MSTPILPFATWDSGTNQNSIPANDNALRAEILQRDVNNATTAQPVSPADGDTYIIQSTHTGTQWATFDPKDLAIYKGGTWYAFAPVEGVRVTVGSASYIYDGGVWTAATAVANRSPAIQSVASSATVTPTFSDDIVIITAQAAGLTLANPTGTAIPGLGMVIRIKDNGTARSIAYGSQYRAIGVTLPTTTVISKTLYLCMVFNNEDTRWDVLAVGQEA
jgi:hypothetical protein